MKDFAKLFLWINIGFFVINAGLMYIVPVPMINLISALACLIGAFCSWQIYTNESDNE